MSKYSYNGTDVHVTSESGAGIEPTPSSLSFDGKDYSPFIDAMLSADYDRDTLLRLVGVPVINGEECYDVVDYDCRRKIRLGRVGDHWRLILLALLTGGRQELENACREAIARNSEAAARNIPKAYSVLMAARKGEN